MTEATFMTPQSFLLTTNIMRLDGPLRKAICIRFIGGIFDFQLFENCFYISWIFYVNMLIKFGL